MKFCEINKIHGRGHTMFTKECIPRNTRGDVIYLPLQYFWLVEFGEDICEARRQDYKIIKKEVRNH